MVINSANINKMNNLLSSRTEQDTIMWHGVDHGFDLQSGHTKDSDWLWIRMCATLSTECCFSELAL